MTKQRIIILIAAVFAGILLAVLLAFCAENADDVKKDNNGLMAVTSDAFGEPFTLTDHTGKTVTEKDYAGTYRLIYFGFTYCPAICPTELAKITSAMNMLDDKGAGIQPLHHRRSRA